MPEIDLTKHIREVGEWSRRNFPNTTPLDPAEGLIEEIGELARARVKRRCGIRGTAAEWDAKERDAIGDAGVFLCNLASQLGIHSLGVEPDDPTVDSTSSAKWFAQLALDSAGLLEMAVDGEFDLDYVEPIAYVATSLEGYARSRGWGFLELLDETWTEVRKRDWILWPKTGMPPKEVAGWVS